MFPTIDPLQMSDWVIVMNVTSLDLGPIDDNDAAAHNVLPPSVPHPVAGVGLLCLYKFPKFTFVWCDVFISGSSMMF